MNVQLVTIVSLVAIPFSTALGFCAVLLGLFSFDDKRKKIISEKITFIFSNKNKVSDFSQWWSEKFFLIFGGSFLSKRQLLSVPFFTILYSSMLFVLWFMWLLIFDNPDKILPKSMPLTIKMALNDFISNGFVYSLCLDFISIAFTRVYIKYSIKNNFNSIKGVMLFVVFTIAVLLLYTLVIHHLRLNSIEDLYVGQRLYYETRPNISWSPFSILASSLNINRNETLIIVTSKGWLSNYFMPQALMLYTSLIAQLSMIMIFMCYLMSRFLAKTEVLSLILLKKAGTPQMSAWGFIMLALLFILTFPLMVLLIASFMPVS
ncbi:TPA: hypothetical protein I8235_005267 [Kluyvera intermedia]|nr:hypothetical protein [Kluyvera intermedia]